VQSISIVLYYDYWRYEWESSRQFLSLSLLCAVLLHHLQDHQSQHQSEKGNHCLLFENITKDFQKEIITRYGIVGQVGIGTWPWTTTVVEATVGPATAWAKQFQITKWTHWSVPNLNRVYQDMSVQVENRQ
jgi:hypothetical protein